MIAELFHFLSVLGKTLLLDISDVCYQLSSERVGLVKGQDWLPERGIRVTLKRFLSPILLNLLREIRDPWPALHGESVLAWVATKNHAVAVNPLLDQLEDARVFGSPEYSADPPPVAVINLIALPYFFVLAIRYLFAGKYLRESMSYFFDVYWQTYGYYIYFRRLCRRNVSAVILLNDHGNRERALLKAANDEGITTIYIQHASVTELFPPLEFDYALLDGIDALEKYESGRSETKVYLVGIMRFDRYLGVDSPSRPRFSIGVCTNALDPNQRVAELCRALIGTFADADITLRPHPGQNQEPFAELAEELVMNFSNSLMEEPAEFLRAMDVIIAGDSNILLEAAILNVFPFYYDFALSERDHYGFLRNRLVKQRFCEPSGICRAIQECSGCTHELKMKAKRYCATLGTQFEGHSTSLALQVIRGILDDSDFPQGSWQRLDTYAYIEAYGPADCQERSIEDTGHLI